MTYVQYINCDKWKKVIGITLWSGTTIGLGYFLFFVSMSIHNDEFRITKCDDIYDFKLGGFKSDCHKEVDYSTLGLFLGLAIAVNVGNWFMIWRTLNNHYRWLLIKCGTKPVNVITGTLTEKDQ